LDLNDDRKLFLDDDEQDGSVSEDDYHGLMNVKVTSFFCPRRQTLSEA
jgi:hypothetical protein